MPWQTSALCTPWTHNLAEMDVTLGHLQSMEEVFLPTTHVYKDHYAKVGWRTALVSLNKVGCAHLDALVTRFVAMATAEEVAASYHGMRQSSNVLLQDFWMLHGSGVAMASLREVQVRRVRGKALAMAPDASERRATDGGQGVTLRSLEQSHL